MLTKAEAAGFLAAHDGFAIVSHRRPDGDTIGSSALLCRGLRRLGKTAYILENPEVTPKFAPLHQGLTRPRPRSGDTVVSVDVAAPGLIPDTMQNLPIALRIDHHGTAGSFSELELVDPGASSCGEIIYDLLTLLGVPLDVPMANALYTALSTDTGCFRYANTNAHTFETAAVCARAGADIFNMNLALFETNSLARLRLQGWIAEHTIFLQDGKIAVCPLPRATEQALEVTEDDMDNISGFPRTIAGVKIAAMLRETGSGRIKLSVRAVPGCDAAAICSVFGGGGHKGAAGAELTGTLEEAGQAVIQAMPKL